MPEARGGDLEVTAGSDTYHFPIYTDTGGKRTLSIEVDQYQPGDPTTPWRIPIHPWYGGLSENRLHSNPATFAKANADTSLPGLLQHPPRVNSVTVTNGSTPFKMVEFDSKVFILGGRYMYYYDPAAGTVTEDKDFGVGKAAVDMAVFQNELIVAMGESEKIWRRTTSTWTQASDNTFAISLGVVDSLLWRAETTNKLSSCAGTPLTLANWAPTSPNQYVVGDTTYAIHTILDYQGAIWVGKGDGMYSVDPVFKFHNQTPQLRTWPHADNCKGAFVAHGSLWVPSAGGLIRVRLGSSIYYGPEVTLRPDYHFWVRGGVEFGPNTIYLLVTDQDTVEKTAVIKMVRNFQDPNTYIFHEWCRLDDTTKGYAITVTTKGTNPHLIETFGNNIRYQKLGRGGGKDTDDSNYEFSTSMELESGLIKVNNDMSVKSLLQGVEVVLQQFHASDIVRVAWKVNNTGSFVYFYDPITTNAEEITGETQYTSERRYITTPTELNVLEIKIEGTINGVARTNRQDIREVYAFGYSVPKTVERIKTALINDGVVATGLGIGNGLSVEALYELWLGWKENGTVLTVKLPDYDENTTVKCMVSAVNMEDLNAEAKFPEQVFSNRLVAVILTRLFPAGLTS